ncbi:MAG: NADH-quinone oxidoreductase subunit D, partial [Chloroflexota bacterium]
PVLKQGIEECNDLLTGNEVLLARTKGVGVFSAADAIDFGWSGPTLRASGVAWDVRRSDPYSIYDRFEFGIPVGSAGDSYDRYYLRVEEMRQSLRIVEQAMSQLPEGPIRAEVPKVLRPTADEVYVHGENPRGDFGVYLVSQGGEQPYRLKIRAPSFCNLTALEHLLKGCYVADAVAILGSLDILMGEVDR